MTKCVKRVNGSPITQSFWHDHDVGQQEGRQADARAR